MEVTSFWSSSRMTSLDLINLWNNKEDEETDSRTEEQFKEKPDIRNETHLLKRRPAWERVNEINLSRGNCSEVVREGIWLHGFPLCCVGGTMCINAVNNLHEYSYI